MTEARATYQRAPSDWCVEELADHAPTGRGEHAWFYVEKENLNTMDVVDALAAARSISRVDVGYAGRKDKIGITRQWFSARTACDDWPEIDGTRCIEATRHGKKLRVGMLTGNRFRIVLRDVCGWHEHALQQLSRGAPNRFGPQRFSGENLERARHWLANRPRGRRGRGARAWHLSVLRSYLFNEVLGHRDEIATLPRFMSGDLAVGGFPSAPLWGRGRSQTRGPAADIERDALGPHAEICAGLEHAGVAQMRRALFVRPRDLRVAPEPEARALTFQFELPPGAYATTLLGSVFDLVRAPLGQERCEESADGR